MIKNRVRTQQRGFTITELIIIIVVIAILAAVAIPQFTGATDDAKRTKASAILESLKASYQMQKAIKKNGNVSITDIIAGHDPACTLDGTTATCGLSAIVNFMNAANVGAPSTWTCTVYEIGGACAL